MGSSVTTSLSSIVESNASLDIDRISSIKRPIRAADHIDVVCLRRRYLLQIPLLTLLSFAGLLFLGLRVMVRIREDTFCFLRRLFRTVQPYGRITSDFTLFLLLIRAVRKDLAEVTEVTLQRIT